MVVNRASAAALGSTQVGKWFQQWAGGRREQQVRVVCVLYYALYEVNPEVEEERGEVLVSVGLKALGAASQAALK